MNSLTRAWRRDRLTRMALLGVGVVLAALLVACASSSAAAQPTPLTAPPRQSPPVPTALPGSPARPTERAIRAPAASEQAPEPTLDASSAPFGASTQQNEAGQVALAITWQAAEPELVFAVAMSTHSVDLDGYDLQGLAVLRTSEGLEASPSGWQAPKGGHHRQGKLVFAATASDGSPLVGRATRSLELVVRNVAGVPERVFQWSR